MLTAQDIAKAFENEDVRKFLAQFPPYQKSLDQSLDSPAGRQITNFPNEEIDSIVYSPEGKSILVVSSHLGSEAVVLHDTAACSE